MRRLIPIAAVLAALTLGGAAAPSLRAHAGLTSSVPPARTLTMQPLAPSANGDTLHFRLTWRQSADALGPAERYTVMVTGRDPAGGTAGAQVLAKAQVVTDTTATLAIVAPPIGASISATASVTAVRRGQTSAPATLSWTITRPDAPPPAPSGLRIDSLPYTQIGAVTAAECTAGSGRLFTAGPHLDTRSDTAFFVRPLPELPVTTYCVAPALTVLAEGDVITEGQAPADSITTYIYPPGAVLPYAPPGTLTVPATRPSSLSLQRRGA